MVREHDSPYIYINENGSVEIYFHALYIASMSSNPNELLTCPYDPVHRVAAKRFPYHLQKCRKVWKKM